MGALGWSDMLVTIRSESSKATWLLIRIQKRTHKAGNTCGDLFHDHYCTGIIWDQARKALFVRKNKQTRYRRKIFKKRETKKSLTKIAIKNGKRGTARKDQSEKK